jgi:hypothetical protein
VVLDGAHSIPSAVNGQQLPVSFAADSCLSFGHSAGHTSSAMTMAHRLSLELRSAEDRIRELEAEVEYLGSRAIRAEQWLGTIKKEIEDTLIAPMEANRSKPQMLN